MPTIDRENLEFIYATEMAVKTNSNIYLTGKAGTGKTTFLKFVRENCDKKNVVLAFTGVAAVNAKGQTINSFFNIAPSVYVPSDIRLRQIVPAGSTDRQTIYDVFRYNQNKLDLLNNLQMMIIDEVSMVRCDLLDVVDRLLRVYRKRMNEPFGGVQVIMIGDPFQLPPVSRMRDWEILKQFYKSPYFFSAEVFRESLPIYIELNKVYRQTDHSFVSLLNKVRLNQVTHHDLVILNSRYNPTFVPPSQVPYIILATHNDQVKKVNEDKLDILPGTAKYFDSTVTGCFPIDQFPAPGKLQLKIGAQVMFLKNDRQKRYFNGKIGTLKGFNENGIVITVPDSSEILLVKETWNNVQFSWNNDLHAVQETIIGTFTQYPLTLAWAITVHKSQGLTFDHIIADLGASFTTGQVYVALSRCTSFSGLELRTPIPRRAIMADARVIEFTRNATVDEPVSEIRQIEIDFNLESQEIGTTPVSALAFISPPEEHDADGYYASARQMLKVGKLVEAWKLIDKAVMIRDDRSNDLFRRVVLVWYKRLTSQDQNTKRLEQLCNKLTKQNEVLISSKAAIQKQMLFLKERTKEFELEQHIHLTKEKEMLHNLEAVRERNGKFEKELEISNTTLRSQEQTILRYKAQAEILKRQYDQLSGDSADLKIQTKILSKQTELLMLQKERLEREVKFLSKRSWFSNLLGITPAELPRKERHRR